MSLLQEMIAGDPIHERRIEMRTYPGPDHQVVVEGWLRDERFVRSYRWSGEERSAGVVHWMCVRMLVGGEPPTILDVEADMPEIPNTQCRDTIESLKKIVNLPIAGGFSEEVRQRLGGVAGCHHLTHLVITMGPAALHGFWTMQSREQKAVPTSEAEVPHLEYLINSCRLWDENGPFVQRIRERFGQGNDSPSN